eukprot:TRINITY_DN27020_c0_g1_i1.p1 TRINITY_DN27020_c0_g1~~TRINITY_DN27020_c0_g1_i1.p1  ORF type:complete len:758 (-),score=81.68 TRINITY_DN27020_c0_g1_i1:148-2421(-)
MALRRLILSTQESIESNDRQYNAPTALLLQRTLLAPKRKYDEEVERQNFTALRTSRDDFVVVLGEQPTVFKRKHDVTVASTKPREQVEVGFLSPPNKPYVAQGGPPEEPSQHTTRFKFPPSAAKSEQRRRRGDGQEVAARRGQLKGKRAIAADSGVGEKEEAPKANEVLAQVLPMYLVNPTKAQALLRKKRAAANTADEEDAANATSGSNAAGCNASNNNSNATQKEGAAAKDSKDSNKSQNQSADGKHNKKGEEVMLKLDCRNSILKGYSFPRSELESSNRRIDKVRKGHSLVTELQPLQNPDTYFPLVDINKVKTQQQAAMMTLRRARNRERAASRVSSAGRNKSVTFITQQAPVDVFDGFDDTPASPISLRATSVSPTNEVGIDDVLNFDASAMMDANSALAGIWAGEQQPNTGEATPTNRSVNVEVPAPPMTPGSQAGSQWDMARREREYSIATTASNNANTSPPHNSNYPIIPPAEDDTLHSTKFSQTFVKKAVSSHDPIYSYHLRQVEQFDDTVTPQFEDLSGNYWRTRFEHSQYKVQSRLVTALDWRRKNRGRVYTASDKLNKLTTDAIKHANDWSVCSRTITNRNTDMWSKCTAEIDDQTEKLRTRVQLYHKILQFGSTLSSTDPGVQIYINYLRKLLINAKEVSRKLVFQSLHAFEEHQHIPITVPITAAGAQDDTADKDETGSGGPEGVSGEGHLALINSKGSWKLLTFLCAELDVDSALVVKYFDRNLSVVPSTEDVQLLKRTLEL